MSFKHFGRFDHGDRVVVYLFPDYFGARVQASFPWAFGRDRACSFVLDYGCLSLLDWCHNDGQRLIACLVVCSQVLKKEFFFFGRCSFSLLLF